MCIRINKSNEFTNTLSYNITYSRITWFVSKSSSHEVFKRPVLRSDWLVLSQQGPLNVQASKHLGEKWAPAGAGCARNKPTRTHTRIHRELDRLTNRRRNDPNLALVIGRNACQTAEGAGEGGKGAWLHRRPKCCDPSLAPVLFQQSREKRGAAAPLLWRSGITNGKNYRPRPRRHGRLLLLSILLLLLS